jgi:hypothetical protein
MKEEKMMNESREEVNSKQWEQHRKMTGGH